MEREERIFVDCAIGRLFRILGRPFRAGDVEEYEKCRRVVMDLCDPRDDYEVNYARDRLNGAAGD